MNTEIVLLLQDILFALYILIALITLGVIANWIRTGISLKNIVKKELTDLFTEEVNERYDEGNYNLVLKLCDEKLSKKPNHSNALWFKAKAHYQLKEYKTSKNIFQDLATSEPSWLESHIRPYLKKLEETRYP